MWLCTDEVLKCLVGTFKSKPVEGLAGVISVRTESWNSKDGLVVRSQKSQALGGLKHYVACCRLNTILINMHHIRINVTLARGICSVWRAFSLLSC